MHATCIVWRERERASRGQASPANNRPPSRGRRPCPRRSHISARPARPQGHRGRAGRPQLSILVGPVTVRTRVSAHASPCARKSCWVGKPGVPATGLGANPHRRANGVGLGGPFRPRVN